MRLTTGRETVLAIPDTQIPFHHPDTIEFLKWVADKYQPTQIVHLGDEVDFHAMSDYTSDPDGHSPGKELKLSIEVMKDLYREFPTCKVVTSNHTARPFRRAFKSGIPKIFMKSYREFLEAPDTWEWRDHWEIDGVTYFHGEGFSGPNCTRNVVTKKMASCVFGHTHAHAGVYYYATEKNLYFGFNAGCLVDNKAYAFAYSKNIPSKPIVGCGVIRKGIPQFIPMLLNPQGRWIRASGQGRMFTSAAVAAMSRSDRLSCPVCKSDKLWKKGHSAGRRRYKCKDCGGNLYV